MSLLSRIFGGAEKKSSPSPSAAQKRMRFINQQITAAKNTPGSTWTGIQTSYGDDSLNKEYLIDLASIQSRSQDSDINNPDLHGFHRSRNAQIIGNGVVFKSKLNPKRLGLQTKASLEIGREIDHIRRTHSKLGGFDSTGNRRSEGTRQVQAMLTALVLGSCLIHRVWKKNSNLPLPLTIELIPGSRISTPLYKMGDPKISYGVQYTDEHRTEVVGWWVRRVSKTVGNNFIQDYNWDFIPVIDGVLLSLVEIAGIDRSLPISTSAIKMLRDRGQFIDSTVSTARAQSQYYGTHKCASGQDPWQAAEDDSTSTDETTAIPTQFIDMGDGVKKLYLADNEEFEFKSAKLPEPNLKDFMDITDSRIARGLVSSLSAFTREVTNSYSGGQMEKQQDYPIIEQYRDIFISAWQVVNEWFIDAIYLTSAVKMPGYAANKIEWSNFHCRFSAKVHINPVDTQTSREKALNMKTASPQHFCDEDNMDLEDNLRQTAEAIKMANEIEEEFDIEPGSLKFITTNQAPNPPVGEDEKQDGADGAKKKPAKKKPSQSENDDQDESDGE